MTEEKKRQGRRDHLNDFYRDVSGNYVYTGVCYEHTGGVCANTALLRRLWLMAAVCREARLLLHGIAVGAILMAVYDILRFLRMLIPHGSLAVELRIFVTGSGPAFLPSCFCTGR